MRQLEAYGFKIIIHSTSWNCRDQGRINVSRINGLTYLSIVCTVLVGPLLFYREMTFLSRRCFNTLKPHLNDKH